MGTFVSFLFWILLSGPAAASPAASSPLVIVAHRGGQLGSTENSLQAVRTAAQRGISIAEVDVRTTRDGELVIMHDETVDRTTSGTGQISELTLAELRRFRLDKDGGFIPTLSEALATAKDSKIKLMLDIKPGTSIKDVLRTVQQERAETLAIFGIRRSADIGKIHLAAPSIPTLAFMPNASDAAEFTYAGARFIRLWSDWLEEDPTLVERTRRLGAQPWIMIGRRLPSNETEWKQLHDRMLKLKPDGLITDRPDLISLTP